MSPHGVVLLLVGACLGCSTVERLSDCESLADTANPQLNELRNISGANERPRAEAYKDAATRYGALRRELKAVRPADPELSAALDDYLRVLERTEKQLLASGRSLKDVKDRKGHLRSHQQAMQSILTQERAALTRLRAACRP
jgi:DNA repair exonuclease SbcCD ATPase subunit